MTHLPMGGYTGKILRVDLSNKIITEEIPDADILRKHVGGTGLAAKYLYDEVPAGVAWDSPENRIMFFPGPLAGTKINGSGTFAVVSKGAMTGMGGSSQANGYFGAFLKLSGYDGIIVQGQAEAWVYLHVQDGTAELRDARELVGKDTWETEDAIKAGLKRPSSVYAIGPAGENLVRFASIVGDHGHVAAHNGLGAVMGSKKLKAICVVRGKTPVKVADPEKLAALAKEIIADARAGDPMLAKWGTGGALSKVVKIGMLPVKNYTTNIFPEADQMDGEYIRTHFKVKPSTCWACAMKHCRQIEVTEGPYAGTTGEEPEYEGLAAMGPVIGQTDAGAAVMLGNRVDRLGMDINESGWLMGWLMECYQKGLLKQDDMDGIALEWGDAEAVSAMLEMIAYRRGNGDIWAEGVKRSAEKIGGEALNCAVYTQKGASPRGHDHRARWTELVDTCLANTGTVEVGPGVPHPEQIGLEPIKDPFDPMAVSTINAQVSGRRLFEDSLGVCFFCMQSIQMVTDALSAITGWDFTVDEAMKAGKRAVNVLRCFAFRHGLTKDIEAPSTRYGSAPLDGPAQGRDIMPHWDKLRRNYYNRMGWDEETGKPLPQTLEELGLAQMAAEL